MAVTIVKPEDTKLIETVRYIQETLSDVTEITPMLITDICNAIAKGADYPTAAMACGIHPNTLVQWLKRGNSLIPKERTPLLEAFAKKISQATAQREILSLQRINTAAEGGAVIERTTVTSPTGGVRTTEKYATANVNADMWYLERKHPERWGKTTHSTVDIQQTIKVLSDDELDIRIKKIIEGDSSEILEAKHSEVTE